MNASSGKWCRAICFLSGLVLLSFALAGCGGGGGGGSDSSSSVIPSSEITGTVSGTCVFAIDEDGKIAGKDDTAGRSPEGATNPPRYRFRLNVPQGRRYHLSFIVNERTPTERIVPLHFGATNVFSIGTVSLLDLGFVDTSGSKASAEKDPFANSGVTPGAETGPPTIKLEGYKYLLLLDDYDNTKRYRAQVRVKDAAGNALTNGSLVKDIKIENSSGTELAQDGAFIFWNGSNLSTDNGAGIVSNPVSDIETYLAAAPGTLSPGFYKASVTDNNGNLHTSYLRFETPAEVGKPTGLYRAVNADNSITLSWTNPSGISGPAYSTYLYVLHDDGNGDGQKDLALMATASSLMSSYTIPAGFAQSALAGKNGLKWMIEIRQQTSAPVTFPDGSASTAHFYRVRSVPETLYLPTPAGAYSQADLEGIWDVITFHTGQDAKWIHGAVLVDSGGDVTYLPGTWKYSDGSTATPTFSIVLSIDGNGMVSRGGPDGNSSFQGSMSADKKLIFATESLSATTKRLIVYRKRVPGVAYGNADFANIQFTHHELRSGTDNIWSHGTGSTDGSGNVSVGASYGPTGLEISPPESNVDTFQVDSTGIVTSTKAGSTWHGIMTPDKKVIFATLTSGDSPNVYKFQVIMVTGQTYAQADYAGIGMPFHLLRRNAWARGTTTVDSSGAGTYLTWADSVGGSAPGNFIRVLSPTGAITDPADSNARGQMSFGKDIIVRTSTNASGNHGIVLGQKR
jgi:hypothetical protein